MKIAPSCRAYLNSDKKNYVDTCVTKCEENKDLLYLNLLKVGKYKPSKSEATWPVHVEDDTVILIGIYFISIIFHCYSYFNLIISLFNIIVVTCYIH